VVIAGQLAVLAYLQISEPSLGAILSTRSRNASLLPKTPSPPRTGWMSAKSCREITVRTAWETNHSTETQQDPDLVVLTLRTCPWDRKAAAHGG